MQIKRWAQASLVATAALLGVAAVAPAAQAGHTKVMGHPRLHLDTSYVSHANVQGTATFGNHETQELSLISELNTVTYTLPRKLPVAAPINSEMAQARQAAMKKLAHLANTALWTPGQPNFGSYEKYLEIIDAAEIAYAAALEAAYSPQALAVAMQQAIGHGQGRNTIDGTQLVAHDMRVGSALPFRPAGAAYIAAVNQQEVL